MPTKDPESRYSRSTKRRERAGMTAFPERGDVPRLGGIGLEPEFFPVLRDAEGTAGGPDAPDASRMVPGVLEIVDELASHPTTGSEHGRVSPPAAVEFPVGGGRAPHLRARRPGRTLDRGLSQCWRVSLMTSWT